MRKVSTWARSVQMPQHARIAKKEGTTRTRSERHLALSAALGHSATRPAKTCASDARQDTTSRQRPWRSARHAIPVNITTMKAARTARIARPVNTVRRLASKTPFASRVRPASMELPQDKGLWLMPAMIASAANTAASSGRPHVTIATTILRPAPRHARLAVQERFSIPATRCVKPAPRANLPLRGPRRNATSAVPGRTRTTPRRRCASTAPKESTRANHRAR